MNRAGSRPAPAFQAANRVVKRVNQFVQPIQDLAQQVQVDIAEQAPAPIGCSPRFGPQDVAVAFRQLLQADLDPECGAKRVRIGGVRPRDHAAQRIDLRHQGLRGPCERGRSASCRTTKGLGRTD